MKSSGSDTQLKGCLLKGIVSLPRPSVEKSFLLLLIAFAFVHGLVYLSFVPPWQHYDEPTHFEYIRLIAERKQLPNRGDYSLSMRREIAASMIRFDFWASHPGLRPDLLSPQPPNIGATELHHPPFYYLLTASPQILARHATVELQLYLARLVSIVLNQIVILTAYVIARRFFPNDPCSYLIVPTFIALIPAYTDLMSAVNNDVGAVALFSLLLASLVILIQEGISPRRMLVALGLAALGVWTKSTSAIGVLVLLVGVGLALARGRRTYYVMAASLLLILAVGLEWDLWLSLLMKYVRFGLFAIWKSVLDWQHTAWVYPRELVILFKTFWARFGWNHIGLGAGWYVALAVPTLLGLTGILLFFLRYLVNWRRRRGNDGGESWRLWGLMLASAIAVWGLTLLRVHPVVGGDVSIWPAARYAYPAIIPTVMLLLAGWRALTPARWWPRLALFSLVGLALLDVWSLLGGILLFFLS